MAAALTETAAVALTETAPTALSAIAPPASIVAAPPALIAAVPAALTEKLGVVIVTPCGVILIVLAPQVRVIDWVAVSLVAAADRAGLVLLDRAGQVALGLDVELFAALVVLEIDLIEVRRRAPLAAAGLDAAAGHPAGKAVGRSVVAVVDRADDQRPVRVAFEERDDDFVADAGNELRAEALAGPELADADPA